MADELLIRFLQRGGVRCPVCNYDLTGLTDDKCPECGEALKLAVRPRSGRGGAWIVGLLAHAGALGFFLIVAIYGLALQHLGVTSMRYTGIGLVLTGALMGLWFRYRGSITRMDAIGRWALIAGSYLLNAAIVLLFFVSL